MLQGDLQAVWATINAISSPELNIYMDGELARMWGIINVMSSPTEACFRQVEGLQAHIIMLQQQVIECLQRDRLRDIQMSALATRIGLLC